MFDVMDGGVFTIIALIILVAVVGWIVVSFDLGIGIIIGVVIALLIMLFWPMVIELFI